MKAYTTDDQLEPGWDVVGRRNRHSPTKRPSQPALRLASTPPTLIRPSPPRPPLSDYHVRPNEGHVYGYVMWPRPSYTLSEVPATLSMTMMTCGRENAHRGSATHKA